MPSAADVLIGGLVQAGEEETQAGFSFCQG